MADVARRSFAHPDPPLPARPEADDAAPPLAVALKSPRPGLPLSAIVHVGLAVVALFLLKDGRKFEDAQEAIPVEVIADGAFKQITRGERTGKQAKPRVDRVSDETETKPHPPLAEAKKDVPTPPPPLKRLKDPGEDDAAQEKKPQRVAALPPARPKAEQKPEPKPRPAPPVRPKTSFPNPEREEVEAEIVRPKPPPKPKPEAKETPTPPKPEKPKPRLKPTEVAKLLRDSKTAEAAEGDVADKPQKAVKPKSGAESQRHKFDAASISDMLSHEAPQRRASRGREASSEAAAGAPTGAAPKLSTLLQGRIDAYTIEHYGRCWRAALSLNAMRYVPRVEFRLTRSGALEGAPRLLNPSNEAVERARGEQALAAVRRCSPMPIPPEFEPYFDYWHVTELDMREDM